MRDLNRILERGIDRAILLFADLNRLAKFIRVDAFAYGLIMNVDTAEAPGRIFILDAVSRNFELAQILSLFLKDFNDIIRSASDQRHRHEVRRFDPVRLLHDDLVVIIIAEDELLFGIPVEVYDVGCHVRGVVLCHVSLRKLFGGWTQVIVQIEAFEEAFAHVIGQVGFFDGGMHKIDRPLCCIQNNAAVITTSKMLFEFLA
jgi:hypothetical protein